MQYSVSSCNNFAVLCAFDPTLDAVVVFQYRNYACAVCCQSTTDLSDYWLRLDEEIAATPMPDEYKDTKFWILCRDCQKVCELNWFNGSILVVVISHDQEIKDSNNCLK